MVDKILVAIIIAVASLYVGGIFFRKWRQLSDPKSKITCDSGCCGCSDSDCSDHEHKHQQ